jgi:hypothetical protein
VTYIIYSRFEIYSRKIPTAPLREVRINNFAALERWLRNTGRNFRAEKWINTYQQFWFTLRSAHGLIRGKPLSPGLKTALI